MGNAKLQNEAVFGLQNDPLVWISEGQSKYSTNWKNKQVHWSVLLGRFQDFTITQETQDEYLSMTKTEQDKIKDIGGFVGGTLIDGHRRSATVRTRSLLAFDIDNAPKDIEFDRSYAWAYYSTHKHRPSAPRLRLIIPLDREVSPEEYEAIMRKVAEHIGINYMDATTFQPSRLMFWPSASRGAEILHEYNDAPCIKADDVLNEYPDWRDISFWPTCPGEGPIRKKSELKQKDPRGKKGPIGTFCRTYDVPAAIAAFLPDIYVPAESGGRYTYTKGTTFGGLAIYDGGLFCYSNHSSDPAHGQNLNAFDLVRVHLFGDQDEALPEDTATTKLPSYGAMLDFVRNDPECIRTFDAERREQMADEFGTVTADEVDDSWREKLTRSKSGIEATLNNLVLILRHDDGLKGIVYNELSEKAEIDPENPTPWRTGGGEWTNSDDSRLAVYLAKEYSTQWKKQDIADAMVEVSMQRKYHPIIRYLRALPEWDGTERAETVFIDYLGAEDIRLNREITKLWLLAAVSRVFEPGCKFDYMPVLSGPGGIGKSTLARKLGGKWFSDSLTFDDMRDKTAAEKVQGTWINEISELKGMRKMEVESIKSFISRQTDQYRPAYGRLTEQHPRTCVMIGTSNADDYLKDTTGNRRFWPVHCGGYGRKDVFEMTQDDVDQIWAETMNQYETDELLGARSLLLPKDMEQDMLRQQVDALEQDERAGIVENYLDRFLPLTWESMDLSSRRMWLTDETMDTEGTVERESVSIMEIWAECFGKDPAEKRRSDSDDIARILLQLGWVQKPRGKGAQRIPLYGRQQLYFKCGNSDGNSA